MPTFRLFNSASTGPAPPSGDLAWTSRLLRRDLKSLFKAKKAKLATKISSFFKPSRSTTPPTPESGTITIVMTESARKSVTDPSTETEATPTTAATESDGTAMRTQTPQEVCFHSFYAYMKSQREIWYKSRPIDLDYEERWKVRGIALILSIALELCDSNPTYANLKTGNLDSNLGIGMLMTVLELAAENNGTLILDHLFGGNGRVTRMPADVYKHARSDTHGRVDSARADVSGMFPPGGMMLSDDDRKERIPAIYLWGALVIALTPEQRGLTIRIVERLMRLVFPHIDVGAFLVWIGDPSKRLGDEESVEIRERLRGVLFPKYQDP
ncbi:hypothetical protein P154DRAFT_225001 [Amniculicola lignicola CBS 123094]|uniref:Uncharacterized protein n=1 Tax=Amniculicola lignicola CBS 123094 TaxID=1392246 RepID=A0A6A5X299_9PLEO|nr:hypothetical protein P154DRAFT_225001 [Amniculicola lignicola CBS 123094]